MLFLNSLQKEEAVVTRAHVGQVETSKNQKTAVNFGGQTPDIDEKLFQHMPNDPRLALTVSALMLVYEDDEKTIVSAEKTAEHIQKMLRKQGFLFSRSAFRWHTGSELKAVLGSSVAKQLITYVHHNLKEGNSE